MTIPLSEQSKEAVRKHLSGRLGGLRVYSNVFIDLETTSCLWGVDKKISRKKETDSKIDEYIGEHGLNRFLLESISQDLTDSIEFHPEGERTLAQSGIFSDESDYIGSLLSRFSSLPWLYTISIKMPASLFPMLPDAENEWVLSESMRIVRCTEETQTEYPLSSRNPLVNSRINKVSLFEPDIHNRTLDLGHIYFQARVLGFVGVYDTTSPIRLAASRFKAVFGLLFGLRAVKQESSFSSPPTSLFQFTAVVVMNGTSKRTTVQTPRSIGSWRVPASVISMVRLRTAKF